MKFGANVLIWTAAFGPEHFPILPRLKDAGFDGVEIPVFDPTGLPAVPIRRELAARGLECTSCSAMPPGTHLGSPDVSERRRGQQHIRECLSSAAEMGASILAGPLYSPVGYFTGIRRTADEWKRTVDCWRELSPAVAASGVRIALEPLNRFETYFLNLTSDAAALCQEIGDPNVGILADTFHCNIEEKSIGPALKAAGPHLMHLHTCENDRGTPGSGNVNWPEFFRTVREIRYDGWLTIESFGFSMSEIAAAASIWRDLAASPEAIALDGIRFLRANC
jgi:D-psicose/D-tagatose/L-ribulose 3-epimerase